MPVVTLHRVKEVDAAEVLRFELENRAFFERTLPSLGDADFTLEATASNLAERVKTWEEDASYHYLVRQGAELVGRIGLYGVQRGPKQSAEVGYRIAEKHGGKGYAKAAVALIAREAFGTHRLHRLEGVTSPENIASQLALVKNGFTFWGRSRRSYQLHGVWEDCLFFERLADE